VIYAPISDLTLRATYGTSFRAPSLVDSADQIKNIFIQNLTDPTSSTGVTRGIFTNGGNGQLGPETAKTWSAGLDWKPRAISGLSVSATWYKILYNNRIDVTPNTAMANGSVYAAYIVRRPAASDAAATAAFNAQVAAAMASPAFTPDGQDVVFTVIENGKAELRKAAGVVVAGEDVFPFRPAWLSDGTMLYTADGKIKLRKPGGGASMVAFTATVPVLTPRYTKKSRDFLSSKTRPVVGVGSPALSPDGRQIVFRALNDLYLLDIGASANAADQGYVLQGGSGLVARRQTHRLCLEPRRSLGDLFHEHGITDCP